MGTDAQPKETWSSGDLYENFVGRWSRLVAREFIQWLVMPENSQWLDVGCGTGALSQTLLKLTNPKLVKGIDRSEDYVRTARNNTNYSNAEFEAEMHRLLPVDSDLYDVAVSGLVLNFVPEPHRMINEMKRAIRAEGMVALYVWDYASRMQFMRHFWNAAAALDAAARDLDEGRRFPICDPNALASLFRDAKLRDIETRPIDIATDFENFDDYWNPFLGGQGPAAGYAMSLSEEQRAQLRGQAPQQFALRAERFDPIGSEGMGHKRH